MTIKRPNLQGKTGSKKKLTKDPPGKPKRPLSAYNVFFRLQRQVILDTTPTRLKGKPTKSHGKIGFAELARTIAARWKATDHGDARRYYTGVAAENKVRYEREMKAWKKQAALQLQQQEEERPPPPPPPPPCRISVDDACCSDDSLGGLSLSSDIGPSDAAGGAFFPPAEVTCFSDEPIPLKLKDNVDVSTAWAAAMAQHPMAAHHQSSPFGAVPLAQASYYSHYSPLQPPPPAAPTPAVTAALMHQRRQLEQQLQHLLHRQRQQLHHQQQLYYPQVTPVAATLAPVIEDVLDDKDIDAICSIFLR